MSLMAALSESLFSTGVDTATRYLDLAGVLACALLGGAVSRALNLDAFGFLVVGTVSGLGGGIIRDVLLQHGTPVALTDYAYVPTAAAGAVIAFLVKFSEEGWNRLFIALDAAVIGCWAVAGAQKTLAAGLGWLPAVLLGTISAVGGGAMRDVILGRIPAVFGGNGLYATVAAASAAVMTFCSVVEQPGAGIVGGVALALIFRMTAVRRGWSLPDSPEWQPRSALASYLPARRTPRRPRRRRGRAE
ncbi:trimeric intracellular cation channel family protein [Streptomyces sp. NPDC002644]